ncbi:MAG: hypothetical protein IPO92_16780 [Saprospiraceae bacterium]|nr:hypothetical protein [Saprospiraceae bacterium]
MKVSIALNGAGVNIPHIWSDNNSNGIKDAGEKDFTIPDNDGNYYFLNAELLISYLLEVFPAPTVTVNGSDLGNGATPESSFGSNQGIYGMLPVDPIGFGASGHCDIWRDDPITPAIIYGCGAGCYWESIDIAYFWKLD